MPKYPETADIETASADYAARFSGAVGQYFLDQQTAITLKLLVDLPGLRVLDVGGGHGQLAAPLAENGFEVTVTGSADSCGTALDQRVFQDEARKDVSYLTCDSLNLPFEDKSFDVVISFRLLAHAEHWQDLIAELCRVASKSVIIDYADKRSSNILYEQFFGMKKQLEGNTRPFILYSRSQISEEFRKNGFSAPSFRPEFLLPMVVHRKLKSRTFSTLVENFFRWTGLTHYFGSPVILRSDRVDN
jgi:ubiquinone/menaquinone biosynthesis C-methylase UbiE